MSNRDPSGNGNSPAGLGTFVLVPLMAAALFAAWHVAVVLTVDGIAVGDVDVTWAALRDLKPLAGLPAGDSNGASSGAGAALELGPTLTAFALLGVGVLAALCVLAYWLGPLFDRGGRNSSSIQAQRGRSRRWARPHEVKDLVVDRSADGDLEDRAVFGLLDGKPVAGPRNGSVGVVAPSGAGKTATVVVPTTLRWQGRELRALIPPDIAAGFDREFGGKPAAGSRRPSRAARRASGATR